jgi:hypothetical protein
LTCFGSAHETCAAVQRLVKNRSTHALWDPRTNFSLSNCKFASISAKYCFCAAEITAKEEWMGNDIVRNGGQFVLDAINSYIDLFFLDIVD